MLQLSPDAPLYPKYDPAKPLFYYGCVITANEKDTEGNVIASKKLESNSACVTIEFLNDFDMNINPREMSAKYGETFTLNAQVVIPQGVAVEYQWYTGGMGEIEIAGATDAALRLRPDDEHYPALPYVGSSRTSYYFCEASATQKDGDGHVIAAKTLWVRAEVSLKDSSFKGKLYNIFLQPLESAFNGTFMAVGMSFGALLPVGPIIFMVALFAGFVMGITGLFT
jgi:hypothetical protein